MAFIPGFEYDIFISYAHVDNLGDEPWVKRFHDALDIALAQRIGRVGEVKIWRDERRLEGDQLFDKTIETAIEKAAIFLALTSNGYIESVYCQQELQHFCKKSGSEPYGLQIEDRSRIYNVLLGPIPLARWPSQFGRITGFPFHDADDREAGAEEEFGEPTDPSADKVRFKRQLTALANALYKMLKAFKDKAGQPETAARAGMEPAPSSSPPVAQGPRVFVADVADPLVSVRKRLVTELKGKGITVETAIPPPYDADSHAKKVQAATKETLLSIHILDELPGREIDGEPGLTYPRRQVELASGSARAQLIWVQKELDSGRIEDEGYRVWLDQLEKGERKDVHYDFVRGSSTLLVPQVLDRLEEMQKAANVREATNQAILLDTHFKDQIYALELGKLLLEKCIQPYINPQEDDPNKNLDAFEARLRNVSSVVILYGNVSESWVRNRLGIALQLSVIKNLPIKSFWVLLVPPEKAEKSIDFQLGPVAVRRIDNSRSSNLDRSTVAALFEALQ